jgi:hypothetical protein
LRVILAVVFIFAATIWSSDLIPEGLMPWAMIVVIPLAVFLAFVLFDRGFLRRLLISDEKYIEKQLEKGRAARETHNVTRALSFEDLRTGRMVHFLELGDGSVMVLYGQYLYEYEPIDDDPEVNQPRLFPTSEFTVVRPRNGDELLDLKVGSNVIGTRLIREPDDYQAIADLGFKLKDGEIVGDVTFDQVEAALATKAT